MRLLAQAFEIKQGRTRKAALALILIEKRFSGFDRQLA